jgi:flagellar biosynthesis chaperone FliJ
MRLYCKSYQELCHFRSHYQQILPNVARQAKPLIVWYIDCLEDEITHRQGATAHWRKAVRVAANS